MKTISQYLEYYKNIKFWILVIMLQIISLRPLYKYVPDKYQLIIPFFLLACIALAFIFYSNKASIAFLDSRLFLLLLFVCLCTINYFIYPIADSLKTVMRGSDQDDSLIDAGLRLISGKNPYDGLTYFGNPLSPGPGLVILALPFTVSHIYFLLTPVFVVISAVLVGKSSGSNRKANLFMLLLMSSVGFWETMVVGSDLWAVGCLFLICVILLFKSINGRLLFKLAIAVIVAMAASARIIFAYIIPLFGIFVWKQNKVESVRFVICAGILFFILHGIFYYREPQLYTPLHLLTKGNNLLAGYLKWICLIASFGGILYAVVTVRTSLESWIVSLFICLMIPLCFVSLGDLILRGYSLSSWEGSNYLIVTIPLLVTVICLKEDLLSIDELPLCDNPLHEDQG